MENGRELVQVEMGSSAMELGDSGRGGAAEQGGYGQRGAIDSGLHSALGLDGSGREMSSSVNSCLDA